MSFRLEAIEHTIFSHLYGQSDDDLRAQNVIPYTATSDFGFPCRVSLRDARVGERLLLLNHEHLAVASPYRSAHAIFVIDGAETTTCEQDQVPEMVRQRLLSIRAFDDRHMMLDAAVCHGSEAAATIERLLDDASAAYLHLHTATRGCYLAAVSRADLDDR